MMRIFVDTSAFYALLDRDDGNHEKAKKEWVKFLEGTPSLVTTNYVLLETLALLQSRLGLEAVRGFQEDVFPILKVEFVIPELHRAGTAALLSTSKRKLSLVDCVSFAMMRDLGIRIAFAFDAHFKEQGFDILP